MPYIDPKLRPALDKHIDALAAEIISAQHVGFAFNETAFAGMLNYSCTRLALKVIPARRYWAIALVTGVFKNIADEFYRRYGVPYEDEQITKNGDVY
jgi:uncharacterized protein DUF6899